MTGTPIVNRPIELFPILSAIDEKNFGNFFQYAKKYCAAYRNRFGWDFKGASNLEELQKILRTRYMVRRLKKDVLTELPPKQRQVIELPPNGLSDLVDAEQEAWQEHENMVFELKTAVELSKASDDPEDYQDAVESLRAGVRAAFTAMARLRKETALAKVPYVIEHVRTALESGSEKVVVFTHHHDVTDALQEHFKRICVKLDGRDSMESRNESVRRFQEEKKYRVFIGGIKAAGVGLTLTSSSHVVFSELDWVPGNMSQAEDRCHRIGQDDSVLVQHLVLEGSLDATMAQTIVRKQNVIDKALDDPTEKIDTEPIFPLSKGEPATQNVRQKEIGVKAKKLTDKQIAKIHDDLRYLAALCDGARSLDGMGYNKFDVAIGKSLASAPSLTARQAVLGQFILKKYRRQLSNR